MDQARKTSRPDSTAASGGPLYGLGVVGAAVYYFKRADSAQEYALALPKALAWPATLVYSVLKDHEPATD